MIGKVLVVDDQPAALQATAYILRRAGFEVLEATRGQEALTLLEKSPVDLVLLDVVLPDIEGTDVCRQIKTELPEPAPLVILMSATRTDIDSQVAGLEVGADGYLTRPVGQRELLAHVRAMMRIREAEKALRRSEQLWRNLFEVAGDGIMLLDEKLEIVAANPEACRLFGYWERDLFGMSITALCPLDQRLAITDMLKRNTESTSAVMPLTCVRKSGEHVSVELNAKAAPSDRGFRHVLVLRTSTSRAIYPSVRSMTAV